jgi:ATP-dependent helicase/nuclease subunit B
VAEERARQAGVSRRFAELSGNLAIDAPAGKFNLTAKADRIDRLTNGAFVLIDYKTGGVPQVRELDQGFAPQLPLEAAIAIHGGFPDLLNTDSNILIQSLEFWQLCGNAVGGRRKIIDTQPEAAAATALFGLRQLIAVFDRLETGYAARPRPSVAPRYSDYEHLARVKEWSAGAAEPE